MWLLSLLAACDPAPDTATAPPDAADLAVFVWPDPLSTPTHPTLSPDDFAPASSCEGCHPDAVAEWSTTPHRWAMRDPLFQALVAVRQRDKAGTQDAFCTQCHSPIATRGGEITPMFSFDDLSPLAMEGVTCVTCHQATRFPRRYNAGLVLDATSPMRGGIQDPHATPAHTSLHDPAHSSAALCASCHDVTEVSGLDLERPYAEWQQTPAAAEGRPCQSCHMPTLQAPAAVGGPVRTRHSHRFVGVDLPLEEGLLSPEEEATLTAEIEALLQSAASLTLHAPATLSLHAPATLTVDLQNNIDGHSFPTGSTFLRQCWLEIQVIDAEGRVWWESGGLDANGDLQDRWSALAPYGDPNLITLHSGFLDDDGQPTLFTHLAAEHASRAIPALYTRTFTYHLPALAREDSAPVGPLTISARLRFRQAAPFLLRAVGAEQAIPRVPIYDIDTQRATVAVE